MNTSLSKAIAFLNCIGLLTIPGRVFSRSFLPGIIIKRGTIFYDHKAIAADLLHEAGHVATIPSKYRMLCSGDLENSMPRIWRAAEKAGDIEVDKPIFRALIQASESEAIAWSWAAGKHLGLPEEEIITNDPRHFNGEGPQIRVCLGMNSHFGIHGLRAAGFLDSVKAYPHLNRWVQV